MSGWMRKRFWKSVSVEAIEPGYTVTLDGRPRRTPAKAEFIVPTRALAELIAEEWRAQKELLEPVTMPATRSANAAIDKVRGQHAEVAAMISDYGDADLLCYRAQGPEGLLAREALTWDPLIDWAHHRYGIRPRLCHGVVHAPQPPLLLDQMRADVLRLSAFELTACHDLVAMSGSLIIGLALIDRFASPEALWRASRVDEDWQIEQWGPDDTEASITEGRRETFMLAARFYFALQRAPG